MAIKLKLCPFCGSAAVRRLVNRLNREGVEE